MELAENYGFAEHELTKFQKIVEKNGDKFKQQYQQHIGKRVDD